MILYLHGFNSSPQSRKAQQLKEHLEERGMGDRFACPLLPHRPNEAIRVAEQELQSRRSGSVTLVGSSLGGFYATYLSERHGLRAVLINPAIDPHVGLRPYIGTQRKYHSDETYELTDEHLREWERQFVPDIHPERYLLLVETGDEVLDYRVAVKRYRGAQQVVVQGGDHSFSSFSEQLPLIIGFAGMD
jgi:predicted esterase YcpF (UPF0227 family)